MSRLEDIIREGDAKAILAVAANARLKAEDGVFCQCEQPDLHGNDLMCGNCLCENRDQIARREARIRGPHPFEPRKPKSWHSDSANAMLAHWCDVCSTLEDDPRHRP